MKPQDRIFALIAAVFLLGTVGRLARSAEPPQVSWPQIPRLPVATSGQPADPAALRSALNGNVFSAARTPPTARFRLGGGEEAMAYAPQPAPTFDVPPPPPPPPPRYRVAGTMLVGADAGFALIDADPTSAAPEVYRRGDAVGGYRLERIAYDHVVLVGAAGEVRMDVARPGETVVARAPQVRGGMVPNASRGSEVPMSQRAKSSANNPPGAIPPGW